MTYSVSKDRAAYTAAISMNFVSAVQCNEIDMVVIFYNFKYSLDHLLKTVQKWF